MNPRRRLLAVALVGLLPWTLVTTRGATTLFFAPVFVNLAPPRNVVTVYEFLFEFTRGLPDYILSWPTGTVLYVMALLSAVLGVFGYEDRRVTAGLLVLVGLTQLSFAWGFASRPGYLAVPFATIATFVLVWWVYWPAVRRTFLSAGGE